MEYRTVSLIHIYFVRQKTWFPSFFSISDCLPMVFLSGSSLAVYPLSLKVLHLPLFSECSSSSLWWCQLLSQHHLSSINKMLQIYNSSPVFWVLTLRFLCDLDSEIFCIHLRHNLPSNWIQDSSAPFPCPSLPICSTLTHGFMVIKAKKEEEEEEDGEEGGRRKKETHFPFSLTHLLWPRKGRAATCELRMPGLVSCASSGSAVLKSGWEKKARANAVLQDRKIWGLEASQVPAERVHSGLEILVATGMRWIPRRRVSMREQSPENGTQEACRRCGRCWLEEGSWYLVSAALLPLNQVVPEAPHVSFLCFPTCCLSPWSSCVCSVWAQVSASCIWAMCCSNLQ